jgi:PLP dependent protein
MTDTIQSRLHEVQHRIRATEQQYGRAAGSVTLIAVSKGKSANEIRAAYDAGQRRFGESYVQEALPKIASLAELDIEWHFIGPTQSNKTRRIAEQFSWLHSLDRTKVAQRLHDQRPPSLPPLNVCLQINISHEQTKAGIDISKLTTFTNEIQACDRLCIRGLMAIPALADNFSEQRRTFRRVREAQDRLNSMGWCIDTLSMGMSNDMEAAIAEGSTMVRIGTAIFGERVSAAEK